MPNFRSSLRWVFYGVGGALSVLLSYEFAAPAWLWHRSAEDFIFVSVGSPAVQTRERLINDRFEQVAWADQLLKSTMSFPEFTVLAPQSAASPQSDRPSPDGKDGDSQGDATPVQVSAQRITRQIQYGFEQSAWFERMLGFRDRVRLERADAMLDDRHDMDDNTLYSLSFDTAIVPASRTNGFAAVEVLLTNDPDELDVATGRAGAWSEMRGQTYSLDRFRTLRRQDLYEIYYDWLQRTQHIANLGVTDAQRSLGNRAEARPDLIARLHRRICERISREAKCDSKIPEDLLKQIAAVDQEIVNRIAAAYRRINEDWRHVWEVKLDLYIKELTREARHRHIELAADYQGFLKQSSKELFPSEEDVEELCRPPPQEITAPPDNEYSKPKPPPNSQRVIGVPNLQKIYDLLDLPPSRPIPSGPLLSRLELPCPPSPPGYAQDKLLRLEALVRLLDREGKFMPDPTQIQVRAPLVAPDKVTIAFGKNPDDEVTLSPTCLAVQVMRDTLDYGPLTVVPGRGMPGYGRYFKISVASDQGGWCRLDMRPKLDTVGEMETEIAFEKIGSARDCRQHDTPIRVTNQDNFFAAMDAEQGEYLPVRVGGGYYRALKGVRTGSRDQSGIVRIAGCFAAADSHATTLSFGRESELLGGLATLLQGPTYPGEKTAAFATAEAYPYGLTPRIGASFKVEGREQGALDLVTRQALVALGGKHASETDLQSREVIGFVPRHATGTTNRTAEFGWLVAPKSGTDKGPTAIRGIPLGALISVPSWWRTALLRICAVGLEETTIPKVISGEIWTPERRERFCRVETLRLPGTAQDIPRRLGIEVMTTPFVRLAEFDENTTLRAGYPAKLLLQGGRLWRSTVVTLGGQRADQIVVLPNLWGIIAEFNCIERPHRRSDQYTGVSSIPASNSLQAAEQPQTEERQQAAGVQQTERSSLPAEGAKPTEGRPLSRTAHQDTSAARTLVADQKDARPFEALGKRGEAPYKNIPVIVWTSEGQTTPLTVTIEAPPDFTVCRRPGETAAVKPDTSRPDPVRATEVSNKR